MSDIKVKRPINMLYSCMGQNATVTIWLYEQTSTRIQGKIKGFDEFMNLVVEEAVEISTIDGSKETLGSILLKGDNITLVLNVNDQLAEN